MNIKIMIAIPIMIFLLLITPVYSMQPLTLEDAIKTGLENNFDIKIARNNAKIASNNAGYGTAGLLPTVNLSGNYLMLETDETSNSANSLGDTETESWGGSISLNWTLFDGFKMFIEKSKYNELARLGEYQAHFLIENNVVAISSAYFDLVRQELILDAARETNEISEARFQKETVRKELGGASSTDYLNAQVAYNRDQSFLINQELNVITARKNLNIILGQDQNSETEVVKEIMISPLEIEYDEILKRTLENNKEIKIAGQNKIIAKREAGSAYSLFIPKLSLNASYGYTDRTLSSDLPSFNDDIFTEKYDATIGLNLTFNLFNGGRDKIAFQNARLQSKNYSFILDDIQNRLSGLTRETYETFIKQLQLVTLEQQNSKTARQNLELIKERYQMGAASSLEFRDAQVSLLDARTALITSKFRARLTQIQIDKLIGEINIE